MRQMSSNSANMSTTRWVLTAVIVVILLFSMWLIRGVLLLMLASIILVVLFSMPTRFFIRRGIKRVPATILSLVCITALLMVLFSVALPTLVQQFATLATRTIPAGIRELADLWNSGDLQRQYPFLSDIDIAQLIDNLSGQIGTAVGTLGASVLPVLGGVADIILSILIVIFLSLYILSDPQMHQEGLIKLFPVWYRHRVREILARLDYALRGWLRATVISMAFVAVATGIGLALLGVEQAAALGVLSGLLSFIPNFGPVITLIPSLAVGIVQAPENIGWILIVIYGVSFVQSQVVGPLLVAGSINLPAVLVLLGQIVAGYFFGFLGIMLAVPLTAIIMVLVQEVYIKDVLGDHSVENQPVMDEVLLPDGV
jgi:predicted PurR-regulated permease PerM